MSHHRNRARTAEEKARLATLRAIRATARAQRAEAAAQRAQSAAGRASKLAAVSLHQLTAVRHRDAALALRGYAELEHRHEAEHGDEPLSAAAREAP